MTVLFSYVNNVQYKLNVVTVATATQWATSRRRFVEAGGNATQSFGLGRIIGQIYAVLYLSPRPLCLDDIVTELGVSKASVSTTVRQLQSWGAVKRVWIKGDRKDYYDAEIDFKALLRNGLLDKIRRKLDSAGGHIDNVESTIQQALEDTNDEERKDMEIVASRVQRAKQFRNKVNDLLNNPLLDHLL